MTRSHGYDGFVAGHLRVAGLLIVLTLVLAGCGSSGNAEETALSKARLSVTAANFTTTVRADGTAEVPFAETLVIEAEFEEKIYGLGGQTSVFAEASPLAYRVERRSPPNLNTYRFAITNRSPGAVEISIFDGRDSEPLEFTLLIGIEEDES